MNSLEQLEIERVKLIWELPVEWKDEAERYFVWLHTGDDPLLVTEYYKTIASKIRTFGIYLDDTNKSIFFAKEPRSRVLLSKDLLTGDVDVKKQERLLHKIAVRNEVLGTWGSRDLNDVDKLDQVTALGGVIFTFKPDWDDTYKTKDENGINAKISAKVNLEKYIKYLRERPL